MKTVVILTIIVSVCFIVKADVYMQNPRGSNNRLNEKSATRANNNRAFDSQNNNRGGYNVGDATSQAANNENQQYRMRYFESGLVGDSELEIQWTQQHGCGNDKSNSPLKMNCNMVIQYMCQPNQGERNPDDSITIRNGQQTQSQNHNAAGANENEEQANQRKNNNVQAARVLQESWEWYDACYRRQANEGLFTADQKLKKNARGVVSARSTRQNPNGGRSGYECPEERDYYPYWHPSPWIDAAVLASNSTMCDYYKENSFNRKPYGECITTWETGNRKHWSESNNPEDCEEEGGTWVEFEQALEYAPRLRNKQNCEAENTEITKARGLVYKWGIAYVPSDIVEKKDVEEKCFVQAPPVECIVTDFGRVNHLGDGPDGERSGFKWKLPYFPSGEEQRCVTRLRYNISTDDFDPWKTDASDNEIIENNPEVDVGSNTPDLQLAINTAQFGRTFEDRSHVFEIVPRPSSLPQEAVIKNLNVRGKRGNIVQTFPATEYDFVPNTLKVKSNEDLVHIQWTGSNTHNNGAPKGDGQQGDDGQGKGGTDRNNFVQMQGSEDNFPSSVEVMTMTKNMNVVWNSAGGRRSSYDWKDLAVQLASSGYYKCMDSDICGDESVEDKEQVDQNLNGASPSYAGLLTSFKEKAVHHYASTRNNNFSNRSQKGTIVVQ